MSRLADTVFVVAAIGLMIYQFQLASQLKFVLVMLMAGVEIFLALLLGLLFLIWMVRSREWIHPATAFAWLSLWFPVLLIGGHDFFVDRRIAQIGPARIHADTQQLLMLYGEAKQKPDFEKDEASRWERIPLRDARVGPALKELGGFYVEPVGESQLDIRTGGWVDSYEGLMVRTDGAPPEYNTEDVRISRFREVSPGLTWISWDF